MLYRNVSIRIFTLLLGLAGISAPLRAEAPSPTTRPFLLHLPGIGGHMRIDDLVTTGLRLGGLDAELSIYDWTQGQPGLAALAGYVHNVAQAEKVARMVADVSHSDPSRRIIITSHSGGGAIAVWSLERLPDDVKIDTLVMIAPALSPQYDLSRALAHVKGRAYVFSSTFDPILSLGTSGFGTMDRVNTNAAGYGGFVRPERPADGAQYEKLVAIPYDKSWTRFGNAGDHIGAMMRPFAINVIAPLLTTGRLPHSANLPPATRPTTAATPPGT